MPRDERDTRLYTFDLAPGRVIGNKYVVESRLGGGWEGEVYRVNERRTGARRAAKLFFPQRNERDKAVDFYAKKLEQLRGCPIVIEYHHQETLRYKGAPVSVLISEYVEGTILSKFIAGRPGKRLPEFEALHVLYGLAAGLEQIHTRRDYHGDIHAGNVLIQRRGVHFDVKLVDLFNLGRPTAANIREDVVQSIKLFYDMLGGQRWYQAQRQEVKWLICGLKRSMIAKRFPTARHLREHLDTFQWFAND
ncbi:MAG: protein kinase [Phycisphaeraceae bacterium]|nr:protein kinase [Phycisphaerales bacterium]MCB9860912.1 protein kinase [Phycisphaeraceae bacterium]